MLQRWAMKWLMALIARALAGEIAYGRVLGMVRHGLTTLGGLLVAKGIIDESMVEPLVGAGVTAFGTLWSLLVKKPA